jgi:hypothetical protein
MTVNPLELSPLKDLPPDILHSVLDLAPLWHLKILSCASIRLRETCLPTLFRRVKFEFSEAGLRELGGILKSDVRCHIVSFTYVVPDLFIPSMCPYGAGVCANITWYRNTGFQLFYV